MHHARPFAVLAMALVPLAAEAALLPGHLDPDFGLEGKRIVGASLPGGSQRGPARLLEGPGGKLYVVGSVERPDASVAIAIARLTPDGDIDGTFGDAGLVEYQPQNVPHALAYGAVFDAQQRLVVVGQASFGGSHLLVCRLDADGAPDLSFGVDATPGCVVQVIGQQDWANDVLVQSCPESDACVDGMRLLVAATQVDGASVRRGIVAAFRADGAALDTTFGEMGLAHVYSEFGNELASITRNATGAIAAAGWVELGPTDFDMLVLRLDPDGAPESEFAGDGLASVEYDFDASFQRDVASSVHLDDEGNVLLAGYAQLDALSYRPTLAKLQPDGELHSGFDEGMGPAGMLSYAVCGQVCDARFTDIDVLSDGRIVAAGYVAAGEIGDTDLLPKSNTFVMRIGSLGFPDPTFKSPDSTVDGVSVIDHGAVLGNSDDRASSVLLQDDRIVVAGYARAADPDEEDGIVDRYDFALARIGMGGLIFSDGFE